MIALRVAALDLGPRRVVRDQLGVDVQLADAAGDQLGELAAEVEDDDGIGLGGVGPVGRGAVRGRGVEGGLEVGLDLGVVGGEDAVAGVRRLAVDGLAALRVAVARRARRPRRSSMDPAPPSCRSSPSAARSPSPSARRDGLADRPGSARRRAAPQSRLRIASAAMSM